MRLILSIVVAMLTLMVAKAEALDEFARSYVIADSLHSIGRTDSAVMVGAETIALAKGMDNPTMLVAAYSSQGVFLRSLGRVDEALDTYGKALDVINSGVFGDNPDDDAVDEIASLYINLAVLALDMQDKEAAVSSAERSCYWVYESEDIDLKSTIYGVAGSVFNGCGMLEKAMKCQEHAYEYALKGGNTETAFRSSAYTMLIADRLNDEPKVKAWREQCHKLLPEIESTMALLQYYQAECSISLHGGRHREAIGYFNKILSLDGIDNLPFVKYDCYNNMHTAYSALGDYDNAYNILLKSNELRDSIWAKEKEESLNNFMVKYKTVETELALAKSEASRSSIFAWLLAVIALLLLVITLFVVFAGRQRRRRMQQDINFARLKADIARQYVEGLESERKRMAAELHDGVCNDLLSIRMNIDNGAPLDDTAHLIDNCRESLRRISHELMPPEFAFATLNEVIRFYVGKQAEAHSGVAIAYTPIDCEVIDAIPDSTALVIYRIVQEAVSNALQHSGATKIHVVLHCSDGIRLTVTDNGDYGKNGSHRGMGLDSMRRRANSIGGTLAVEQAPNGGTEVVLIVP
ncbi:MAG: ATP-binding protein [Bacteroidales bacterium]|nr:ATP-binding protein [Bacteroidales bacterium]MDD6851548.1 ATP-binding protein [Bacteroidales bacterium]